MAIKNIEEYINGLDIIAKKHVEEFMEFMKKEFPQLNYKISFSMPMWLLGTKMTDGYVAVSASKNHFSIHFSDEKVLQSLAEQLPLCKTGKRCINIKYGDEKSFLVVKENVKSFVNSYM